MSKHPDPLIRPRPPTGFTLVELVIVIVVLAAGLVGILSVFNQAVVRSADPVLQQQAVALAEGYMEEILGMSNPGPGPGCSTSGGGARGSWESVGDYDAIDDEAPSNVDGSTIAGLADYRVSVAVVSHTLSAESGCRITVTVTAPGNISAELNGFRAHDD